MSARRATSGGESGIGLIQVVRGLLLGLFGFGFGVGFRRELFDGLAEADGTIAGGFCFEGVEAAWDVQVLGHVSRGNALADVLEAAACSFRVLACKCLDLASKGSVVAEDITRGAV